MKNLVKFVILASLVNLGFCARILGIFNMPSYSHFILGEVLLKELAKQGHEVTMISPFGQKTSVKNYRDIELVEALHLFKEKEKELDFINFGNMPWIAKLFVVTGMGYVMTETAFENKNVQKLITSHEEFDLVIMETFLNEALYGFAHKFKAPVIILATSGASMWVNRLTANPSPASYIVEPILSYYPNMAFFERINNLVCSIAQTLIFNFYGIQKQNALMHKHFPEAPDVTDLVYNTSFVLLNSHPAQSAPVPLTPNMKEIGGFHIKEDKKLPEDLKKFLDNAKEGVIYFALGSNLKSKDLPPEKLKAILGAFKKWKKPILWKFEDESLPGKPENVKISKWLPQTAVLAHPNLKAFISHGGKLSIMESTYFGVPIVGIPFFAEQPFNVKQLEYAGNGFLLDFRSLTEDTLYDSIVRITSNPKYTQEAKVRSQAMRSGKIAPLEEAVHWVEYVLKFKGSDHLRSHGINLPWYQLYMIDAAVFVGLMTFGIIWLLRLSCKKICRKYCNKQQSKQRKTKTH